MLQTYMIVISSSAPFCSIARDAQAIRLSFNASTISRMDLNTNSYFIVVHHIFKICGLWSILKYNFFSSCRKKFIIICACTIVNCTHDTTQVHRKNVLFYYKFYLHVKSFVGHTLKIQEPQIPVFDQRQTEIHERRGVFRK